MPAMFDWSKYGGGGGNYVSGAEKQALAEAGAPFTITGVTERESRFEHDEFAVSVILPEGVEGVESGERTMTFAKGTGANNRDNLLTGLQAFFAEGGDDQEGVRLEKYGRAYVLVPPS